MTVLAADDYGVNKILKANCVLFIVIIIMANMKYFRRQDEVGKIAAAIQGLSRST